MCVVILFHLFVDRLVGCSKLDIIFLGWWNTQQVTWKCTCSVSECERLTPPHISSVPHRPEYWAIRTYKLESTSGRRWDVCWSSGWPYWLVRNLEARIPGVWSEASEGLARGDQSWHNQVLHTVHIVEERCKGFMSNVVSSDTNAFFRDAILSALQLKLLKGWPS